MRATSSGCSRVSTTPHEGSDAAPERGYVITDAQDRLVGMVWATAHKAFLPIMEFEEALERAERISKSGWCDARVYKVLEDHYQFVCVFSRPKP
jgi:hypothetical protein